MYFKQFFYLFSYFFCLFLFSQNDLTLNDAVLKRWTDFYPENLSNLEWQKSQDFYSYKKNNCLLIFNEKNNLVDEVCIGELNIDDLTDFPDIKWVTNHSFKFEYKNQIYLFNTKRGRKPVLYLEYDIKATNKDYNFKRNLLAYTIENDLFISSIDTNLQINKFEKDIVFGQPVHRYEFGIYKGTFWSPNGNKLAFYKNSQKKVDTYPLLISSDTTSKIKQIKYPMAGDSSEYVEVGIFDVNKNKTIYLETYSESDHYLTNICWGPSEKYIYVAVLNRDQNHLKLNKYDANSGLFLKTLIEEKDEKYVHPLHPIIFLDNEKFLWRSEKDGFDQLYLYNKKGKLIEKVTNDELVVKDFIGFKNNIIYFTAYSADGLDVHLFSYSIDEKKKNAQKKLSSKFPGSHKFKISPSGNFFIDEFSNLKLPRIIQIINSEGDEVYKLLESKNPLIEYKIGLTELVKIPTDNNTLLNSRIIKPYDFDENKKYPVLIYVYNGPQIQLITNSWLANSPLWMYYLANKDYIVFTIDGRGSENRGKEFEQVIFKNLGEIEMKDQIIGYNFLKSLDYVDSNRIALHGWSYGGFMTVNLLLSYPEFFTCGVAGGPVTDWSLYEVMYTERYMQTPNKNHEGFKQTNLNNKVESLNSKLSIIHGLLDDVVVIQHSLKFIENCIEKNIPIDFFLYPNHAHNVRGKDRLHLIQKVINYIIENNK
jgi:dipeptidyl-peptidase-4